MSVERTCIETGKLLREYFSDAGYIKDGSEVVFYAKLLDDAPVYLSVNYEIGSLVGLNQHQIVDKILAHWL